MRNLIEIYNDIPKGIDVVIIDNIGVFAIGMAIEDIRDQLDLLVYKLNELKCTSLLVCDEAVGKKTNDIAMYSVYGGIKLLKRENPFTNRRERVIDIVKMRNTKIPIDYILYDICSNGIDIISKIEL